MNRRDEIYRNIAGFIHDVDISVAEKNASGMVPGECRDPVCWVSNYADGMTNGDYKAKEVAMRGIQHAFEMRYGESVLDAFDRVDTQTNQPRTIGKER